MKSSSEKVIQAYFDSDACQFANNRWFGSERARRDFAITRDILLRELDLQGSHRLLEFGCGPGVWTDLFADRAAEVVGVDVSSSMLAEAHARVAARANVRLVQSDMLQFRSDQPFNRVLSVRMLEYIPDKSEALKTLSRLLVANGRAVIITKPRINVHVVKARLLRRGHPPPTSGRASAPPVWGVQADELARLGMRYGLSCSYIGPVLSRVFPGRSRDWLERCTPQLPHSLRSWVLFTCETYIITFRRL